MIHTTEQLSAHQALTPEGFLLCQGVAIARTGTLIYAAGEIPAEPNAEGVVYVLRTAEEVFAPEAMASFEGKPVTNLHPDDLVNPDNWGDVAVGSVQHVRREGNLLIADLLITDADAIRDVQAGLREVSCGYEAHYEQISPGHARQTGIVGNHVALVPHGRCGPTCAIKDHAMKRKTFKDRLLAAFKTRDEDGLKDVLDDLADGDVHIHLPAAEVEDDEADPMEARLKAIEDAIARLTAARAAEPEDKDDQTGDEDGDEDDDDAGETPTGDSLQAVISRAAILAPGLKLKAPTGDAKSKSFRDGLCGCKRQALQAAYASDAGRQAITPFLNGRTLDALKGASLDAVFQGAATLMGQRNNSGFKPSATKDFGPRVATPADMNKLNAEFWAKRARPL